MHHTDTRSNIKDATDKPNQNHRVVRGTLSISQSKYECVATDCCKVFVHGVHNGDFFHENHRLVLPRLHLHQGSIQVFRSLGVSQYTKCVPVILYLSQPYPAYLARMYSGTVHWLLLQFTPYLCGSVRVSCQVRKVWCVTMPKS